MCDVLTTIIRPDGAESAVRIPVFQARLFDVAPTVLELIGAQVRKNSIASDLAERFVGRPLVAAV